MRFEQHTETVAKKNKKKKFRLCYTKQTLHKQQTAAAAAVGNIRIEKSKRKKNHLPELIEKVPTKFQNE